MKKLLASILIFCILICVSGCNNNNSNNSNNDNNIEIGEKIGSSSHKVELNCPELENIWCFFNGGPSNEHYFCNTDGNVYEINFKKPFYDTKTNVKIKKENGYEYFFKIQLNEAISYSDLFGIKEFNPKKASVLGNAVLTYDENILKVYDIAYTSQMYTDARAVIIDLKIQKEFDENIISINGCIIKTESKYYAIERYIINAEDVKNYADVSAEYNYRIVDLDKKLFAVPIESIKFLYMPDLISDSYFMIDNDNNYFYNKTYLGG